MRKFALISVLICLALLAISCKAPEIGPGQAIAGVQASWKPIYMHYVEHKETVQQFPSAQTITQKDTIFSTNPRENGRQKEYDDSDFLGYLADRKVTTNMAMVKICERITEHRDKDFPDEFLALNNCPPSSGGVIVREKANAGYAFTNPNSGWPEVVSCWKYPDSISSGQWDHGAAVNKCNTGRNAGSVGYWAQLPQLTPPPAPTQPYPELVPWYECQHSHHDIVNSMPQPNNPDCGRSASEFIGYAAKNSGPGIRDTNICRRGVRTGGTTYYDNYITAGSCDAGDEYAGQGPKLFVNPVIINNQLLTRPLRRCHWAPDDPRSRGIPVFNHDVSRYGCYDESRNDWCTDKGLLGYVMITDKWPKITVPAPIVSEPTPSTCDQARKDNTMLKGDIEEIKKEIRMLEEKLKATQELTGGAVITGGAVAGQNYQSGSMCIAGQCASGLMCYEGTCVYPHPLVDCGGVYHLDESRCRNLKPGTTPRIVGHRIIADRAPFPNMDQIYECLAADQTTVTKSGILGTSLPSCPAPGIWSRIGWFFTEKKFQSLVPVPRYSGLWMLPATLPAESPAATPPTPEPKKEISPPPVEPGFYNLFGCRRDVGGRLIYDHYTGVDSCPQGITQRILGRTHKTDQGDTVKLLDCIAGDDHLIAESTCDPGTNPQYELGYAYRQRPMNIPDAVKVGRYTFNSNGEHFVADDPRPDGTTLEASWWLLPFCKDNDPSNDPAVKGSVKSLVNDKEYADKCEGDTLLIQYACDSQSPPSGVKEIKTTCAAGTVCEDGACKRVAVPEPQTPAAAPTQPTPEKCDDLLRENERLRDTLRELEKKRDDLKKNLEAPVLETPLETPSVPSCQSYISDLENLKVKLENVKKECEEKIRDAEEECREKQAEGDSCDNLILERDTLRKQLESYKELTAEIEKLLKR
ncbi:hypothetical protein KY338_00005 [Candidatus Woesearchaeota archaeon]|nr:hypothetical protein [Candidatus Woesearchaeota archaeon]